MSIPPFPPVKEADLVSWSTNWLEKTSASPPSFGLDDVQTASYGVLHDQWVAAYNAVHNPNTNTKQATIAKNQAKEALLYGTSGAWALTKIVQAFPGTTNAMRGELGLRLPDTEKSSAPAPSMPPNLSIVSTFARTISIRLQDQENPSRRGKPEGIEGATILYHVGEESPADPAQWSFAKNVSRTICDVTVPASIEAGSRIWLTAFWFNARKESSKAATAESTRIADGLAQAA